ncbi:hypothetical protein CLV58_109109 [Spirosoma oryzae]|uniref:Uncharacterized protein n=1 Tax=Spirosoma oryzae TaxID=1469603 RepID=A0A2T0SY81_9BACT|nr:hypothetical protein [Spirosoma oryzae]PRY38382.1 hypothetical protein CLV58_109109 [Spirosoma oryzae]
MDNPFKKGDWVVCIDFMYTGDFKKSQVQQGKAYRVTDVIDDSIEGTWEKDHNGDGIWLAASRFQLEDPFQTKIRNTLSQIQRYNE